MLKPKNGNKPSFLKKRKKKETEQEKPEKKNKIKFKKKNTTRKKKKRKPQAIRYKYKVPSDVRWFYVLPSLFIVGVFLILGSVWMFYQNRIGYQNEVLASSMQKGEALPIRENTGDDSSGTLTLGNTILSKNGKDLAVEIRYDEEAHSQLSSFGDNYKLFLIDTDENPMDTTKTGEMGKGKETKITYGKFDTDGSGVLQIHREKGFEDKAFVVFLLDKGVLVTSEELQTDAAMSDRELDRSVAAQLAAAEDQEEDEEAEDDEENTLPPTYILRINAQNSKHSYRNWTNDREVIEDLFIDENVEKIEKEKKEINAKKKKGQRTLDEMDQRLEQNPQDQAAESSKRNMESTISRLDAQLETADQRLESIESENIEKDVLSPKVDTVTRFRQNDLSRIE